MRLVSLQLTNFRLHSDTYIEFPLGLLGIVGTNASGKSTILEGVSYALFGSAALRGSKGSVRWKRATARRVASVKLVFEVRGIRYTIERTESNATLRTSDIAIIAAGTSVVDKEVPGLLGMGLSEFRTSFLCAQKDLARIAGMGGTERQTFFREVLGIGRIDAALVVARKRKNEIANELQGLSQGLGDPEPLEQERDAAQSALETAVFNLKQAEGRLETARADEAEAKQRLDESDERRTTHDLLQRDLDNWKTNVETTRGQLARVAEEIEIAHRAKARVAEQEIKLDRLPYLKAERERLRNDETVALQRSMVDDRLKGVDADLTRLRDGENQFATTVNLFDPHALEAAEREYRELEKQHNELRVKREGELKSLDATIANAKNAASRIERRLLAIQDSGAAGSCPTCARELGKQYDSVVALLADELRDQQEGLRDLQNRQGSLRQPGADESRTSAELVQRRPKLEQLKALKANADAHGRQLANVREQVKSHNVVRFELKQKLAAMPDTAYDEDRATEIDVEVEALEEIDRNLARDRGVAGRIQLLLRQREEWEQKKEDAESRVVVADADLQKLAFDSARHAGLKETAHQAWVSREAASLDEARAAVEAKAVGQRIERAVEALERYQERAGMLDQLTTLLRTHEQLAEGLDRFRVAQSAAIKPELEELTSGFVNILTDGRNEAVTLSDDFECVLSESGVDMEVVSGGTEDIAALAMRLAVSQMIAQRAGHPLSLLILDEPYGSLDETRRGNVMNLIRRLGSVFEQCIVITHVPEVREAVDVCFEITYSEAEGRSVVTGGPSFHVETPEPAEAAVA